MRRGARPNGKRLALAIAVAGMTLAACSGDDAASPSGTETPSTTATPQTATTLAQPLIEQKYETTSEPAGVPGLAVYRPADLEATDEPLPVIAWANGGCVRHESTWAPLLDRWAASGFVVVAIHGATGPSTVARRPLVGR